MVDDTLGTLYRSRADFTLIELLVVIAIIGVLAAAVLASLNLARSSAWERRVQADLRSLHTAIELLYNDTDLYPHQQPSYCPPRNAGGNEVNLNQPSTGLTATDGSFPNWQGPYISSLEDPWGNPYFLDEDYYCTPGAIGCNGFESNSSDEVWSVLVSCGPDGMTGDDPDNPQPSNGNACAYNNDNIVYPLCTS